MLVDLFLMGCNHLLARMSFPLKSQEVKEHFQQLLVNSSNATCLVCDSPSQEYACVLNGIFLCPSCAVTLKAICREVCHIKSILGDSWFSSDIEVLRIGGNARFLQTMEKYEVNYLNIEDRLCTRAALYYRRQVQACVSGTEAPPELPLEEGKVVYISKDFEAEETGSGFAFKNKFSNAFDKTKKFTYHSFQKLGDKIYNSNLKQGVSSLGTATKNVAASGFKKTKQGFSSLFSAIKHKVAK